MSENILNRIAATVVSHLPENEERAQEVLDMASAMMKFRLPKPAPTERPDNVIGLHGNPQNMAE
ncbi:MAG: hypothetical protein GY789_23115 [Hyphomicrobiales bacterium]|nr:hypothetical protein [Hyphomicrobiales bacterium]